MKPGDTEEHQGEVSSLRLTKSCFPTEPGGGEPVAEQLSLYLNVQKQSSV